MTGTMCELFSSTGRPAAASACLVDRDCALMRVRAYPDALFSRRTAAQAAAAIAGGSAVVKMKDGA